jgi:hypothetical protein
MSPETINEVNAENYQYQKWERELKNKILSIHDIQKKQKLWRENFPVMTLNDDWMYEAVTF